MRENFPLDTEMSAKASERPRTAAILRGLEAVWIANRAHRPATTEPVLGDEDLVNKLAGHLR
jgi:hypothetical protein